MNLRQPQRTTALQFVRYALTGVMNTLLTLLVIYFTKGILGINPWIANAAGYAAGFVNSFVWNKFWVFRSSNGVISEALRFCICFAACYLLQLLTVWFLTDHTPLGGMEFRIWRIAFTGYGLATLIGMIVYTLANFILNRSFTFKTNRHR
ncbi:MAG: GtrA family protein [Paramuribaculum sp.]|nr:GtrA family protein [Paramuribaculum sp.]